jgi:hypothetical protein
VRADRLNGAAALVVARLTSPDAWSVTMAPLRMLLVRGSAENVIASFVPIVWLPAMPATKLTVPPMLRV